MSEEEEILKRAALERSRSHIGHASSRVLTPNNNILGVAGEHAFARDFQVHHNLRNRPKGDGGIDFWVPIMFSIDVKASSAARKLLVTAGKVTADVYVLARVDVDDLLNGECVGFAYKDEVLAAPQENFNNYGIMAHVIDRDQLHPMVELTQRAGVIGFLIGGRLS